MELSDKDLHTLLSRSPLNNDLVLNITEDIMGELGVGKDYSPAINGAKRNARMGVWASIVAVGCLCLSLIFPGTGETAVQFAEYTPSFSAIISLGVLYAVVTAWAGLSGAKRA